MTRPLYGGDAILVGWPIVQRADRENMVTMPVGHDPLRWKAIYKVSGWRSEYFWLSHYRQLALDPS